MHPIIHKFITQTIYTFLFCILATHIHALNLPDLNEQNLDDISLAQERNSIKEDIKKYRAVLNDVTDSILQHYIKVSTKTLVKSSSYPVAIDFFLIPKDNLNAFAIPGGVIGIHRGLIAQLKQKNEFLSIVAHEISHLSLRHHARSAKKQDVVALWQVFGTIISVIASTQGSGVAGAYVVSGLASSKLLEYSREHEKEADLSAIDLLKQSDIDPHAFLQSISQFKTNRNLESSLYLEYLSTHPVPNNRIRYIKQALFDNPPLKKNLDKPKDSIYPLIHYRAQALDANSNQRTKIKKFLNIAKNIDNFAYYGVATIYTKLGQYSKAINFLHKVPRTKENGYIIDLTFAHIYYTKKEYKTALNYLKKSHNYSIIILERAKNLIKLKQHVQVRRMLLGVLQKEPRNLKASKLLYLNSQQEGTLARAYQEKAVYAELRTEYHTAMQHLRQAHSIVNSPILRAKIQNHMKLLAHKIKKYSENRRH